MKPYHQRNFQVMTWSTKQHHISWHIFSWKLQLFIRPSLCWQEDSSNIYRNLSTSFIIELHAMLYFFIMRFNKEQRKFWIISSYTYLPPPHLHFGREENIHGISIIFIKYSFERRAYWFDLKVSRYSLSSQSG